MSKNKHLEGHIISIIQNYDIREQSDLQKKLKERGYDTPQATLSRRLKKLNIAKVSGLYKIIDYKQPYLPIILNMKVSDSGIIVLHTHPGNANSLAIFLDQKHISFSPKEKKDSVILATIAGDDTVLVVVKNRPNTKTAIELIQKDFPYLTISE